MSLWPLIINFQPTDQYTNLISSVPFTYINASVHSSRLIKSYMITKSKLAIEMLLKIRVLLEKDIYIN